MINLLIEKIILMMLIIVVGFFSKKKYLSDAFVNELTKILFSVIYPIALFGSFGKDYSSEKAKGFFMVLAFTAIFFFVTVLITRIIYGKNKNEVEKGAVTLPNIGFFGLPLVGAVLGSEGTFYAVPLVGLYNIFIWSYGVYIESGDKRNISIKKIFTNVTIVSILLGMIVYLVRLPLPNIIYSFSSEMNKLVGPLASILIGCNLADSKAKDFLKDKSTILIVLLKLFILPMIGVFMLKFLSNEYLIMKQAMVILISTPTAPVVSLLCRTYGRDYERCSRVVCVTTILISISIPLMLKFAELVW